MVAIKEFQVLPFEKKCEVVTYFGSYLAHRFLGQCKVFLYPSLRESFGIPILEGMACGVPVITSNTSSMPEIAGDAAVIVDPTKTQEIVDAINLILNDNDFCVELCKKGTLQAAKFSWKNMAINYLELYKSILKK